jgi:elongation factor P
MSGIVKATKLRPGNLIVLEGDLYRVHSVEHRTPGKGNACMQTKLRNVANGNMVDKRFLSDVKVEKANLDSVEMEFLYHDEDNFIFMNTSNYEQVSLSNDVIGDNKYFILPNTVVKVDYYNNSPVGIELPMTVVLKVTETEPYIKRATASSTTKPAVLETGYKVVIPGFIEVDELIKVNTETGEYLTRASAYDD